MRWWSIIAAMTRTPDAPNAADGGNAHEPVFILAPARSCTTVVTAMLGRHPELYDFPELCAFRGDMVTDILKPTRRKGGADGPPRISGLLRAIAETHHGNQSEDSVRRAKAWLESNETMATSDLVRHLFDAVQPLRPIEHSPEDSNREDYLERVDAAFPNARYLQVTRHPVTTARSMTEVWAAQSLWDLPEHLFPMMCLGTWLFHHARVKQFLDVLPADRWRRVRAEDVVNQPAQTLPALCDWLDVSATPEVIAAMSRPEGSPYARLGPPSALGGGDPGFMASPTLRPVELPTSIAIPSEWVVDPWLTLAVAHFADAIGY